MDTIKDNKSTRKYLIILWSLFLTPIFIISLIFILISTNNMGYMPSFEELENPKSNIATLVYSSDKALLGKIYKKNRSKIEYDELSPYIVQALIATEDSRFHSHSGIDAQSLARVIFRTILMGDSGQGGGSTLTQQLAKNLFRMREKLSEDEEESFGNKIANNIVMVKFKEWVTAVRLEKNYTKEEIIAMYLNTVTFGHNTFGIEAASNVFFKKDPSELKIEEAALFAGMVKAPTRYSPKSNPKRALYRRNKVIERMYQNDFITETQFDSLITLPLELNYGRVDHNSGHARYFREYLRLTLNKEKPNKDSRKYRGINKYDYILDSIAWETDPLYGWCNKNFKPDGSKYDLYTDGLRIHTTINSKMQVYAEEAVAEHMGLNLQRAFDRVQKYRKNPPYSDNDLSVDHIKLLLKDMITNNTDRGYHMKRRGASMEEIYEVFDKPVKMKLFTWEGDKDTVLSPMDSLIHCMKLLRAGFMSMEPQTGHVKAYVGGINFKHFKYDAVTQQRRQVGSTIKPFLYTLAMQNGYSPCDEVKNVQQTFEVADSLWRPANSTSKRENEDVTLKWGLANSVNNISAWLMKQFGPHQLVEMAHKMGIKSKMDPVVSLILGTSELKLCEMVGAYATFANKGVHIDPMFVTRIDDRNGNILQEFSGAEREVFGEETAFLMLQLLKEVVNHGTGSRLKWTYGLGRDGGEMGGKTGTTNNHSDGWFMGVTPDLVSGAWAGAIQRSIHFDDIKRGQGANMALPMWALYMQKVYSDTTLKYKPSQFEKPVHGVSVELNCGDIDKKERDRTQDDDLEDPFF